MKRRCCAAWILVLTFFLFISTFLAWAQQPLTQAIGNGEINWGEQVIRATGSGAPNPDAPNVAAARLGAERAAKADALRNILETVKGAIGLDVSKGTYQLGPMLTFNPQRERFVKNKEANALLTRPYRQPFVVPETV